MNQLSTEDRCRVLSCLVEGNSIRATVRITGIAISEHPERVQRGCAMNSKVCALYELAQALGSDGFVKLQFIDELSAIRVTYGKSEALGVLMPCRIS